MSRGWREGPIVAWLTAAVLAGLSLLTAVLIEIPFGIGGWIIMLVGLALAWLLGMWVAVLTGRA